jgi:lipoic acid synthetase
MPQSAISIVHLGRTAYRDALAVQRDVHQRRRSGTCGDTVIITEHEPVITLGRGADARNVLADPARLQQLGIEVVPVERGGDVTYHGPGQLVAYPILDLTFYGRDIRRYVRALEESAIRLIADNGLSGERKPGAPGVWVNGAKIASVGVFISRWVTLHGIAINIDPDLSHFDLIHPCGLAGVRMTSLSEVLGRAVPIGEAEERYLSHLLTSLDPLAAGVPAQPRSG